MFSIWFLLFWRFEWYELWLFVIIREKGGHFPFFIYYHSCLQSNLLQQHLQKHLLYKEKFMWGMSMVEKDKLTYCFHNNLSDHWARKSLWLCRDIPTSTSWTKDWIKTYRTCHMQCWNIYRQCSLFLDETNSFRRNHKKDCIEKKNNIKSNKICLPFNTAFWRKGKRCPELLPQHSNFAMLILCMEILLKLFMRSRSFLLTLKRFYTYNHIFHKQRHFFLFISNLYYFLPYFFTIGLANISNYIKNLVLWISHPSLL